MMCVANPFVVHSQPSGIPHISITLLIDVDITLFEDIIKTSKIERKFIFLKEIINLIS